jgi:hypothetical protein
VSSGWSNSVGREKEEKGALILLALGAWPAGGGRGGQRHGMWERGA